MIWVALAGGLGAVCRFVLDSWLQRRRPGRLPVGTFVINALGSLVLGALHGAGGGIVLAIVGTGFCGGFTTFSTASVEAVRLRRAEGWRAAIGYAASMLVVCVALAGIGWWLAG